MSASTSGARSEGIHMRRLCGIILIVLASAAPPAQADAGRVIFAYGRTVAVRDGAEQALIRGDEVHEGDTLRTGPIGILQLRMEDGAIIALRSGTEFVLKAYHAPLAVVAKAV